MKISKVVFENFKPYCGRIEVDLSVEKGKNIVLIGGRNGQGKTSFLLGVVWCLYGSNIEKVDDIFKKEVKGNYSKFLHKALNWNARNGGETSFSVEVVFTDVELSEVFTRSEQGLAEISIKRRYDIEDLVEGETFEIMMDGKPIGLLSDEDDKVNFVNDYIIPFDIAKFIFFDAEKIAEIALLSAKDQAIIMNDALGKILGLSTYENLIVDLEVYKKNLQKEAASPSINLEINSFENAKKQNELRIDDNEKKIDEYEERMEELIIEIAKYTDELIRRGDTSIKTDINLLREKEEMLNEKLAEAGSKFNEIADLIPFSIIAHRFEELVEHLEQEEELKLNEIKLEGLTEKTKEFADKLFNRPPLMSPAEDINMEQKTFYYQKTKEMLAALYSEEQSNIELDFQHDLDASDAQHIRQVFRHIQQSSKDLFEGVFSDYMRLQADYQEAAKELRIAETASMDEFVQDLQDKKNQADKDLISLNRELGRLEEENARLAIENKNHQSKIENLLTKVQTSKKVEKQIEVVKKYIRTLMDFIKQQKEQKKNILSKSILSELNAILNKPGLVSGVEVSIMPNNLGIEVKLYDAEGRETSPGTDMSKGEQQIYISALLKSILSESIHDLPILIDTPLGRLDQEHRNKILENYYPTLSDQVIIFSTNTEVRVSDLPKIEQHISKKYRLENLNKKTIIHSGYFE